MNESDEVNSEVSNNSSVPARSRHFEASLVELLGLDRRLRHGQPPRLEGRVGVDLVTDALDADGARRLDEHVDGDGSGAVGRRACFDDPTFKDMRRYNTKINFGEFQSSVQHLC